MSSPRVVLTGASRGLGLAVLKLLLERHNAKVATLSRSHTPELRSLVEQYGEQRLLCVQGDVSIPEDNEKVVKSAVETFGGLDSLILNAGSVDPFGRLGDLPQETFMPFVQANLFSMLYLVQAALPHLRKNEALSRVVVVSSGASTGAYAAWGLYSMAKAAQNSMVRTLALEEKGNGVSFYAVRPGVIDTDMQKLIRDTGSSAMDPAQFSKFTQLHEQGELLKPEQPGAAIAALAIEGTAEMSGEFIDWSDSRLSAMYST